MKRILILFVFTSIVYGCEKHIYSIDDLEEINGVSYLKGSKKKYTGETIDTSIYVIINTFKNGENTQVRGYSLDGKTLRFEYNYSNGMKHGNWSEYYENGQVGLEKKYKNDIEDGRVVKYYENGQIESEYTIIEGKIVGNSVTYYDNGSLKTKYDSLGNEYYFYKSGDVLMEKIDGKKVFYDENKNKTTYELAIIKMKNQDSK